MFVNVVNKD